MNDELEKLLAEATDEENGLRLVLRLFKPDPDGCTGWLQYDDDGKWRNLWDADTKEPGTINFIYAALIVAAVNALPELLALREENERMREALRASATDKEKAAFVEGIKAARDTVRSIYTNDPQFSQYTQDVIGAILEGNSARAALAQETKP